MAEVIVTEGTQVEEDSAKMYLDQIENLKKTTVSKEKFDKLMQENKSLLESIVNGTAGSTATAEEETVDVEAIRKDLFCGKELSNLDYCKKALALRNEILKRGGKDIFVGQGHQLNPTQEAFDSAQRVADVLEQCIESSGGDSTLFTAQLMARTNDVTLPKRKKK